MREKAYLEFDRDGKLLGGFGITQDITDRKTAEDELRASERQAREHAEELQAVLDLAPVAVWIAHDPQCLKITGNRYANELVMQVPRGANISASASPEEAAVTYKVRRHDVELKLEELPAQRAAATGQPVASESPGPPVPVP